ncbi:hypothetical protein Dimus_002483 [Dionaea muscipula]
MIKKQTLRSMAVMLGKGIPGLSSNDQVSKISTIATSSGHVSRINMSIGMNLRLRGCSETDSYSQDRLQSGILQRDNKGLDGGEFRKMKAIVRSQQPILEPGVHQENRRGLVADGHSSSQRGSSILFPNGHSLQEKIVVAVDVDEVLGNFVTALNRFIADRYSSNHSVSEYHVYEFFKIWNCSRDEADIRVHEFFKTSYFRNGIHPIPGAQKALHKLSKFCTLSVVTSRQNAIKDQTIEWIEKHYPGLFQEIHFGNHFALDGVSRPKSDMCRSMGAKVLIDDNPRYAMDCAEAGIRVLLFDFENSYPWSKDDSVDQHPLVTRVLNWQQVEQQLVSWISP